METEEARLATRPAQESDRRFCYEVKRAALGPYVERTWGWDEAFQQEFHTADWQRRRPDIIVLDGEDAGTVQYVRRERDYHLGEFYLLPRHHRRGIGSRLLRRMLDRADAEGFPVHLEVIKINPAKSLYERHGFRVCGETATHYQMVREARAPGAGAEVNGTRNSAHSADSA
jgi:ribosomal protein S18 acetylase RimI-like enzyme